MKRLFQILLIAAICLTGSASPATRWSDNARQRKADYLYLESLSLHVEDKDDAAYELLRESCRLNPDDEASAAELAIFELRLDGKDQASFSKAMAKLKRYVDNNPDDYYNALTYGRLLEYSDNYPEAIALWETMRNRFPDRTPIALKLAESLADTNDSTNLRRAVSIYDSILESEGMIQQVFMRKLQMLYAINDTTAIFDEIKNLLSSPGGSTVDNYVLAGSVFDALDHDEDALDYFKKACELDPASGAARYSLASYYLEAGDSEGYDREIYMALVSPDLEPEIKNELLRDYVSNHIEDPLAEERMDELFSILVSQYPHDTLIRNSYGAYLLFKERYGEGAEEISYSLDLDPDQANQWITLVQVYNFEEDFDKALETADNALRYFPDDPQLYYLKAISYHSTDDDTAALEEIEKAISVNNQTGSMSEVALLTTRADILFALGETDSAFEAYDAVLKIDPDNALALNNFAYFLALEGRDLDRAQSMVERSLRISPDNLNAVDTYAWVMFVKKDFQRAREIFDSAIDQLLDEDNASAEAYEHAGDIYFMTGDHDQAVEFWKEALDIDPDNELLQRKVKHETYFIR